MVFTQGGKKPEEIFVPAKPQTQSLLKGDQPVPTTGPGSITTRLPNADAASAPNAVTSETTDSGKVQMVRPLRSSSDVPERLQRIRSVPAQPSPQEEKKKLNKTMSSIEEIMKQRDESVSEEDRTRENEMWKRLIRELNTEKEKLDTAIKTNEASEKIKTEQLKESTEKKTQNDNKPAPADSK